MIVIEGLDNTGKTTLLNKLQVDFPQLQVVQSIGNKHDVDKIRDMAYDSLDRDEENHLVLYDRVRFIAEYVYNPILKRRPIAFSIGQWMSMLYAYTLQPQLLIYCRRPLKDVGFSWGERDQLEGVAENLYKLDAAYDTVIQFIGYLFYAADNGSELVEYDWDSYPYSSIKGKVADYIERVSE